MPTYNVTVIHPSDGAAFAPPTGTLVAYDDQEAMREAALFQVQHPTSEIVVRMKGREVGRLTPER